MRPPLIASFEVIAITIGSMLGIGILGLPVSLHRTGLQPFIITFTFTLVCQICIVYQIVELFQHAVLHPIYVLPPPPKPTEHTPVDPTSPLSPTSTSASASSSSSPSPPTTTAPDFISPSIFALADQFIPQRWLRILYNVFVFFHFILLLVTYTLSAPQAYVALLPFLGAIPFTALCGGFFLFCAVTTYVFATRLLPTLSFTTLFKAALLVFLVGITLVRGLVIHRQPVSRWGLGGLVDPFLLNTFALGGTLHAMPVTFQLCLHSVPRALGPARARFDRAFFAAYRNAVNIGLFVCYLLNVAWCVAVLYVVPQDLSTAGKMPGMDAVPQNLTLAYANENGLISTVPLIDVLKATHDKSNHFVAFIVNVFIAVSITLSIFIMLIATLNFLEGSVLSAYSPDPVSSARDDDDEWSALNDDDDDDDDDGGGGGVDDGVDEEADARLREAGTGGANVATDSSASARKLALLWRYTLSVVMILTISLLNPKALYRIMEGVLTVVNNVEAAVLIVYMFSVSRRRDASGRAPLAIPDKVQPRVAQVFIALTAVFYTIVIFVDVVFYLPSHIL